MVTGVLRPKSRLQHLHGGSLLMLLITLALFALAAWLLHPRGPFESFWRVRQQPVQQPSTTAGNAPPPATNVPPVPLTATVQERMDEDGDYAVRVESSVPAQTGVNEITVQFLVRQGASRWQRDIKVRLNPRAPTIAGTDFPEPKLFGGAVQAEASIRP